MAARKTTGRQRRAWGKLRTLRSGHLPASYVHATGTRYYTHIHDEVDAERWLSNERKLIDLGEWTPPETRAAAKAVRTITVREYAEKWLAERACGERGDEPLAPKTRYLYRELLDGRILPTLGDEMMRAVTPADVRAWWVALSAEKKTPTRNAHAYQLLNTIFNAACGDKLIAANPCQIKSAAKPPRAREVQALTPAELGKVGEAAPERYRVAVPVVAWCGLRFGELIELRRKDVYANENRIVLKLFVGRQRGWAMSWRSDRLSQTRVSVTLRFPHMLPSFCAST